MELTRRDALLALGALGVTETVMATRGSNDDASTDSLADGDVDDLIAISRVLYPSEVRATPEFVATYVSGRYADREEYLAEVRRSLRFLDEFARDQTGTGVARLSADECEGLLRQLGVDRVSPVPDGLVLERIRYYVVDDLLYALYTSPVGGRLVGSQNPKGYPGGTEPYQRGPDDE